MQAVRLHRLPEEHELPNLRRIVKNLPRVLWIALLFAFLAYALIYVRNNLDLEKLMIEYETKVRKELCGDTLVDVLQNCPWDFAEGISPVEPLRVIRCCFIKPFFETDDHCYTPRMRDLQREVHPAIYPLPDVMIPEQIQFELEKIRQAVISNIGSK